jgi:D-psicose/D-tagatose/L-ribulose 3-epimerase
MRIALCNEVIAPMPFPRQCEYAAKLGYDGLEIAPYTLSEDPHRMGAAQIAAARSAAQDCGVAVTGLHWLLVKPAGLSISTKDAAVRKKTLDVMLALIDLCAELGGRYLVHGSPQQRRVEAGETRTAALARAQECFAAVAGRAEKAGVVYCVEPLSSEQTPLINTLEEASHIVTEIGSPAVRTMLDCSSAGRMENRVDRLEPSLHRLKTRKNSRTNRPFTW